MTSLAAPAVAALAADIAARSARLGRPVAIDQARVLDRSDTIALKRPGLASPNRSARLVRAADGWIVVNLPREDDLDLVPAWTGCGLTAEPWAAIRRAAARRPWRSLIEGARLLALPAAGVGEITEGSLAPPLLPLGRPATRLGRPLTVIDLSSVWAGPLAGAILAEAGAVVTKWESVSRPDPAREAAPAFFQRLNANKRHQAFDIRAEAGRAALRAAIAAADVVISGARPRAFEQLGLTPESLAADNPALTWVALTGYGWRGEGAERVAFGDDAAAAGGLVRWTAVGEPRFAGDALADPLTGLAAAAGAMAALEQGGGVLVDVSLARTAAAAARLAA